MPRFLFLVLICFQSYAQDNRQRALKFVNYLAVAQYDSANAMFDEALQAQVSSKLLQQVWELQLKNQVGNFEKILDTKEAVKDKSYLVNCSFSKATLDLRCNFNEKGKMVGFFIPPASVKMKETIPYKDAPYVLLDAISEQETSVQTEKYKLPAIFTFPKNKDKFPLVVFVHGSGPNDKDESIGPNKIFRDLAKGLASKGIGSLRYDKRTKVYGAELNPETTTPKEEVLDDVASAIALAKTLKGVDKIYVLGHSLGAFLAPQIASAQTDVSGIVMMAGNARPLEDLILEQYNYLAKIDGKVTEEEQKSIDEVAVQANNIKSKSFNANATNLPLGIKANYWLYLNHYNQKAVAQSLKIPILILQGELDYQVTMTDFMDWKKALNKHKNVTFKSFPNLNHLFLPSDNPSTPAHYQKRQDLPEEVIDTIVNWIK